MFHAVIIEPFLFSDAGSATDAGMVQLLRDNFCSKLHYKKSDNKVSRSGRNDKLMKKFL